MYRYASSTNANALRSTTPLTNEQIGHYAPSVLASEAHESRGDRYTFIPTIEVLDGLRKEGFQPFEVRQTRCRDLAKRDFTKHLVRLRHESSITSQSEVPEIILLNSHDGTSSYQLLAGFFRFVCSNGLIAGDVVEDVRVRHSGNVIDNVIEGSYRVLDDLGEVEKRIDLYKAIGLNRDEQLALASAAAKLRWDGEDGAKVEPDALLWAKRFADRGTDLYTTFNKIQENIIKGGVRARTQTGRRTSTRAVSGVNENVRLNKALWTLTDQLAKIKNGELELA